MIGDRYIISPLMTYVRCHGHTRQALDMAKGRLIFAGSILSVLLLCILFRLCDITIFQGNEEYVLDTDKRAGLQTARTNIVDRNGELLATTIATGSLYANTKVIQNPKEVARKLSAILSLSEAKLIRILSSHRRFIWVQRHLTPKQQADIIKLGIPGLDIMRDERRVYPHGEVTAHLIGMTDIDNQGIAGVEKSLDTRLRTEKNDVRLSINIQIQHALYDELKKGMEEFRAQCVNGIILNIKTGEILAMASLPAFNPNIPQNVDYANLFDRNISGVYEFGSILKIINTALALESGKATIDKLYDATKPLKVGHFTITDFHAQNRWMTVADIFRYSSNIGCGLMALEAGISYQKEFLRTIGLLTPTPIELPGSASPLYPRHWRDDSAITISYGYGLAVSPMQFAAACATLVNDGIQVKPTLLYEGNKNTLSNRLVSSQTSTQIRALLRLTTTQGTARKANVPGYMITGKTGTAMQRVNGKYKEGILTTSFAGTLGKKLSEPDYFVLITYDRPKETPRTYGFRTAGWNAAPTARKVMERIISILGLPPASPEDISTNQDIKSLLRLAKMEA